MLAVILTMIFKAPVVPYFLTVRSLGLFNNPLILIFPQVLSAFNLAVMRSFFKEFPAEVEEAARMEGCGYFRLLFSIIVPSSAAVLATVEGLEISPCIPSEWREYKFQKKYKKAVYNKDGDMMR